MKIFPVTIMLTEAAERLRARNPGEGVDRNAQSGMAQCERAGPDEGDGVPEEPGKHLHQLDQGFHKIFEYAVREESLSAQEKAARNIPENEKYPRGATRRT